MLRSLGQALYRECSRHAAALRRYVDAAAAHLDTCVGIDEVASLNLSATNLCQEVNQAEATASWYSRSLEVVVRWRQDLLLPVPNPLGIPTIPTKDPRKEQGFHSGHSHPFIAVMSPGQTCFLGLQP